MTDRKYNDSDIQLPTVGRLINPDETTIQEHNKIMLGREDSCLEGLRDLIKQRRALVTKVLIMTCIWLIIIGLIIIFQGFNLAGFHLSNGIIQILIGSTTFNIIGLLMIIIKFIFNPKEYLI